MEEHSCRHYFLQPQETFHRRYEALRALLVDGESLAEVAERFGYKVSALKSIACRFRADYRRGVAPPFFSPTVGDVHLGDAGARTSRAPSCPRSPTAGN